MLALVGGVAFATGTIPGPDGMIHGCFDRQNGSLRVVSDAGQCRENELAIQWNQIGPQGPQGPAGPPGPGLQALPNTITLTASPSSIPANGVSTSTLAATVAKTVGGAAVANDTVNFIILGGAACGSVNPASGTTNAVGTATATYAASTSAGFCTIMAVEEQAGSSGSVSLTQAPAAAVSISPQHWDVSADGSDLRRLIATVTAGGTAVAGDPLSLTLAGAACGMVLPPSGATDASGQMTFAYVSSTTIGSCVISVTDTLTGQSGHASITQVKPPNRLVVTGSTNIPANGTSTAIVTATVTDISGMPVSGAVEVFTTSAQPFSVGQGASCGTLSAFWATTNARGQASVSYTSSSTPGNCFIFVNDLSSGMSSFGTGIGINQT
jgi:adhesin/invasin